MCKVRKIRIRLISTGVAGGKPICLPLHIYYCSYPVCRISYKLQSGLINSQWRQVDDYSMEWVMINYTIQTQKQYYICVL